MSCLISRQTPKMAHETCSSEAIFSALSQREPMVINTHTSIYRNLNLGKKKLILYTAEEVIIGI